MAFQSHSRFESSHRNLNFCCYSRLLAQKNQLQKYQQLQQLGEFETLSWTNESDPSDAWIGDTTSKQQSRQRKRSRRQVYLRNFLRTNHSDDDMSSYEKIWDIQKQLVQNHLDRLVVASSMTQEAETDDIFDATHSQFLLEKEEEDYYNKNTSPVPSWTKGKDTVLLVQHEPVYTLGTGSDIQFLLNTNIQGGDAGARTTDHHVKVVRIERGGEVTYHGPGQLVVYPILDLRGYKQDIHWYLRALEECILLALHKCGITHAYREDNLTGIWIQGKKVAAVGIKIKRWITMHGISINVETSSLEHFNGIVPCGLVGRKVCCINDFLNHDSVDEGKEKGYNENKKNTSLTVSEFAHYLIEAMEEVFRIHFTPQ